LASCGVKTYSAPTSWLNKTVTLILYTYIKCNTTRILYYALKTQISERSISSINYTSQIALFSGPNCEARAFFMLVLKLILFLQSSPHTAGQITRWQSATQVSPCSSMHKIIIQITSLRRY